MTINWKKSICLSISLLTAFAILQVGKDVSLAYTNIRPVIVIAKPNHTPTINSNICVENSPRLSPRKLPLKIGQKFDDRHFPPPLNYEEQGVILQDWLLKPGPREPYHDRNIFSTEKVGCMIRPQHDSENISRLPDFSHLPCSKKTHFFMVSTDRKSKKILALEQIEALQIVQFINANTIKLDRHIQVYDLNGRARYQIRKTAILKYCVNEETLFRDFGPMTGIDSDPVRPPRNLLSLAIYEIIKIPPVANFLAWLAQQNPIFMKYTPPFLL